MCKHYLSIDSMDCNKCHDDVRCIPQLVESIKKLLADIFAMMMQRKSIPQNWYDRLSELTEQYETLLSRLSNK